MTTLLSILFSKIENNKTISGIVVSVFSAWIIFLFQNNKVADDYRFVIAERAYFYWSPAGNLKQKTYIIKGEKVKVEKEAEGYCYSIYESNKKVITTGWLKKTDLD